jgi:hypothetical protein
MIFRLEGSIFRVQASIFRLKAEATYSAGFDR